MSLSAEAVRGLERESFRLRLSRSEVLDVAVRVWLFLQAHQASGGEVLLRAADGTCEWVVFEAGPRT
ncbi:hypothetical protein ACGFNU_32745 [Spirillospora sp. NPDC048911]|uniref:hypothetical protein n=1 Tax=Spirillospora sp. NPDC048911 TaxID=3364527 RepID=UPI00371E5359